MMIDDDVMRGWGLGTWGGVWGWCVCVRFACVVLQLDNLSSAAGLDARAAAVSATGDGRARCGGGDGGAGALVRGLGGSG